MAKRSSTLRLRGRPPCLFAGICLLVRIDVDAPVGALARAQHADRAVFLLERDDAAGARGEILLLVRVLDDGVVFEQMLQGDDHALEEPDPEPGLPGTIKLACTIQFACIIQLACIIQVAFVDRHRAS